MIALIIFKNCKFMFCQIGTKGFNKSYTNTIADWFNNTVRSFNMSREMNFIRFIVTIIQRTFELSRFFCRCLWKDTGCILARDLSAHTKVFPTYLKHLKDTKISWLCHILSETRKFWIYFWRTKNANMLRKLASFWTALD